MKLTVNREVFTEKVAKAAMFLQDKPITPIFECILFIVKDGVMTIIGNNQELQVRLMMPVDTKDQGQFCVPGKILLSTLNLIREPEVRFAIKGKKLAISHGKGKSDLNIALDDANAYPLMQLPDMDYELHIYSKPLKVAMKITAGFINKNEQRPSLMGILMRFKDGRVEYTATDGHSLARLSSEVSSVTMWEDLIMSASLAKAIEALMPSMDMEKVTVRHNRNKVHVITSEFDISSVAIDAKYPNCEFMFEHQIPSFDVNKAEADDAVKRLKLFSEDNTGNIIIMEGSQEELTMTAVDQAYGHDGTEVIETRGEQSIGKVAFSAVKFIKVLSCIDQARFKLQAQDKAPEEKHHKPILIRPIHDTDKPVIDSVFLLMPLQIASK